jgi:hypothetical protein
MRILNIACTNSRGDSITLSRQAPLKLLTDLETTGLKNDVTYMVSNLDGATYLGSRLLQRDISLEFAVIVGGKNEDWIQTQRNQIFKVFNPAYNPIRLVFTTQGNQSFNVSANVESTPLFQKGQANSNAGWQRCLVQLSCSDPYIYGNDVSKIDIATWNGGLEFGSFELSTTGKEIGFRSPSLIVNVFNSGQDKTGVVIQFRARATLTNPSLVNINNQQYIKLNTTMIAGDIINVTTHKGKKKVELIQNNVTTNIFNLVDINSTFLQLDVGDNLFRYSADTNVDQLECSILFTPKFLGV